MSRKPIDPIPKGLYCYDENGICPYWSLSKKGGYQNNGYCSFMRCGDWEMEAGWISLLWDQVKECGFKMDDDDPQTEEELNEFYKNNKDGGSVKT